MLNKNGIICFRNPFTMTGTGINTIKKRKSLVDINTRRPQMYLAGVNIYKMKTALAQHVENDPLYECKDYDENNSFDHCIDKELEVCI